MKRTAWEIEFDKENIRNAKEELRKQRDDLRAKRKAEKQRFPSQKELDTVAQLKALQGYNKKTGWDFKALQQRAYIRGRQDYEMKKARIFRENFLEALKETKNFENYRLLKDELNKIRNPINFYEFISKSETFSDLFQWYDDEAGAYIYGRICK